MAKRTYDFQWNKTKSVIIQDKGFTEGYMREIAEIFERHFYKYIPYDPGRTMGEHLADSSYIQVYNNEHATIVYRKPYTRPVYKGEHPETGTKYQFQKVPHALATSYWDKACWTNEKAQIGKEINNVRKKYVNG